MAYKTYKEIRTHSGKIDGRTTRPFSIRKTKALEIYLDANGRKSKAVAIREAGYPESTARHPDKVFSRSIEKLMDEMGVNEKLGMEILQRNAKARVPVHFTFPPFNSAKDEDGGEDGDDTGENMGERFGEQMTDTQIREYMEGAGCRVTRIVHGDMARHVYGYGQNNKAQLETAKMIFELTGSFAPKKIEGKHDHRVGIFSMKQLRQEMEKRNIQVTDPLLDNDNQNGKQ
jgi:hypothetical protein